MHIFPPNTANMLSQHFVKNSEFGKHVQRELLCLVCVCVRMCVSVCLSVEATLLAVANIISVHILAILVSYYVAFTDGFTLCFCY